MSAPAIRAADAALQVRTVLSPIAGESADGLLGRVAAAECATRMFDFTRLAGASFSHHAALSRQEPDGVRLVARCIGADPDDLAQRCTVTSLDTREIAFFGLTIDSKHVAGGVRRYAPQSLASSPHHRALWMLKPFPFCEESWQLLVEHCPNLRCGAVQRWRWTNGIDICDRCGEQLTRSTGDEVPDALRQDLHQAVGLFHPDPSRREASRALLPAELAAADGGALLDLLSAIAGVVDPSIRYAANRRVIDQDAPAGTIAAAVATAWTTMTDWPSRFESLIGERLSMREGRFGDGNGGATLAFLQLASRAKMHPHAAEAVTSLRERLQTNVEAGYRAIDAASILGVAVSDLTTARRRGDLPTVFHLDMRWRRPSPLIERKAVDEMGRLVLVTRFNVGLELGASPRTIDLLLHRGLLQAGIFAQRDKGVRITRESVDTLVASIASASARLECDTIPLRSAMRVVGGRFKPWTDALQAMLKGHIAFSFDPAADSVIDGIRIPQREILMLLELSGADDAEVPLRSELPKIDALEVLNLPARYGVSVLGERKGRRGDLGKVPTSRVLAIATTHIATAEAALRLSIETIGVRYWMAHRKIRKLSAAGYDRAAFEKVVQDTRTEP